jgi:hypothetical protein
MGKKDYYRSSVSIDIIALWAINPKEISVNLRDLTK